MKNLPEEFIRTTRAMMGDDRFSRYLQALGEEAPVSIRLNPLHAGAAPAAALSPAPVGWCPGGYWLAGRPQFTFDPLFHAGCYYVQEAASMFVSHILRCEVSRPVQMLDLCAAPGGKSTAAIAALPEGSTLVSNEPVPARAQVLLENITKWGWPGCTVTNSYPRQFRKAGLLFDVILCDVPCSGEGMFRKDPQTVGEWSPQNVEKCWRLQRDIVSDAWQCLRPGGLLIYSTCTFNTKENEENVRWMMQALDAHPVAIAVQPEWSITGSLLPGFEAPVYRFIPGITRSEGLFLCALRKPATPATPDNPDNPYNPANPSKRPASMPKAISKAGITVLQAAIATGPHAALSYPLALSYLRGEAVTLAPSAQRGIVTLTYRGVPLGPAKNIGSRANNLYPKPWRIKTTHLPTEEVRILDKI